MSNLDTDFWDRNEEELEYDTEQESSESSYNEDSYEMEDSLEGNEMDFLDEPEKQSSVVDNARIRLEQGRLYEMLIKHDLFEGVDAMPQAINKVQSEIKEFIVERLEILLGMKAEKEKEVHHIVKESQFNEIEVQALKMIARKVTKGASDSVVTESKTKNELNSVKNNFKTPPKPQTISKPQTQNRPQAVKSQGKPQASSPQKQMEKKTVTTKPKFPVRKEITDASPEVLAKQDIKYIESLKNMSLEEAGKIVSEKYARPRSPQRIDQESVNRLYTQKMSINETAQTFSALLAAAKRK